MRRPGKRLLWPLETAVVTRIRRPGGWPGDRGRLFGRERLLADLVDLLRRERFAAVCGLSGIGRSSPLRAGLMPALQDDPKHDGRLAAIRVLTPGSSPFGEHAHPLSPSDELC